MQRVSELRLRLDLYCVVQDDSGRELLQQISQHCGRDSRIRILAPVPNNLVPATIANYDLIAVPSQSQEIMPLVALEAFAAGIPLIGSNLGGIAEIITHEANGLLIEATSIDAWAEALGRFIRDPDLIARLSAGIPPVKSMNTVADEMAAIYDRLLSGTSWSSDAVSA